MSTSTAHGVTIMVIDDSSTIRRSAELFLTAAGYHVVLAADGFDALAKISDHRPALVLCDIVMPRLDGYQTCTLIKKSAKFHTTPVLMLSSNESLFDRARGALAGSDAYLTKPFTRDGMLAAVREHTMGNAGGTPVPSPE
jgi:twitching motility two-component system response regulator PilG